MKTVPPTKIAEIAARAGEIILDWYAKPIIPQKTKSDDSPLTHADEDANRIIIAGLKEISSLPIVTEESLVDYSVRKSWGDFWIVDPLDGTRNFLSKDGQFTVNIALISGGMPIMGVVLAPALNLSYVAERGQGAFLNGTKIFHQTLRKNPIAAVSAKHGSDETFEVLKKAGITEVKPLGSALKLCKLAEGEVDIYPRLGTTCEWDIAPGHLVATEGGCKIIDLKTRVEPIYNKPSLENNYFIAYHRDMDISTFLN